MGGDDGGDAADASLEGAQIAADSQREALDYLKSKERIPSFYQDQALNQLAGFYGLQQAPAQQSINQPQYLPNAAYGPGSGSTPSMPQWGDYNTDTGDLSEYQNAMEQFELMTKMGFGAGGYGDPNAPAFLENPNYVPPSQIQQAPGQQQFIEDVKGDYFYQGMVDQGEEAISRNAAMTGGLRSGNANEALAQNNQNVLKGLVDQRLQGLRGFTGSGLEGQIAGATSAIGQTLGQGQIAAGQALAQGAANQQSNMMGAIGTGLSTYGALAGAGVAAGTAAAGGGIAALAPLLLMSDSRLKKSVKPIGQMNGFNIYSWTWNNAAEKLGLKGHSTGVIADEVEEVMPEAIGEKDGYRTVDYQMIGVGV